MKKTTESNPKKSHFKVGMIAGAVFGLAAGIFMSSTDGKKLTKKLQEQTKEIQHRLQKELLKSKKVTQGTYEEAIDAVLAYYTKTRKIAKTEIPALRRYLLTKWHTIKKELSNV